MKRNVVLVILDYFYHVQWNIESDKPRYVKQYASALSYGLSPSIGQGPMGVRDIALVVWSSGEITEGSRYKKTIHGKVPITIMLLGELSGPQ